jgi:hypothetical protein
MGLGRLFYLVFVFYAILSLYSPFWCFLPKCYYLFQKPLSINSLVIFCRMKCPETTSFDRTLAKMVFLLYFFKIKLFFISTH